jgi:hypothetical protein
LAGHQVADGGFEIGFAEIGFRRCRAKFPIIIDEDKKILIVAVPRCANSQCNATPEI